MTLPSGYTQLQWIGSTGTQYIDTGITLDNNSGIDINYEIMSYGTSGGAKIFGYSTDNNFTSKSFAAANKWAGNLTFTFGYGTQKVQYSGSAGSKYTAIGKHNVVFNNKVLYFDNEQVVSFNDETFTTGNIAIGNINHQTGVAETFVTVRHREYTFTKDGDVVFECVPAKRKSDGAIGMYDLISNAFLTNQGTGNFIAGPEYPKCNVYGLSIKGGKFAPVTTPGLYHSASKGLFSLSKDGIDRVTMQDTDILQGVQWGAIEAGGEANIINYSSPEEVSSIWPGFRVVSGDRPDGGDTRYAFWTHFNSFGVGEIPLSTLNLSKTSYWMGEYDDSNGWYKRLDTRDTLPPYMTGFAGKGYGYNVRLFKNEPEIPTATWEVIYKPD